MRDSLVRGDAFEREQEEEIETVCTVYYKSGEDKFSKGSLINNSEEMPNRDTKLSLSVF